MGALIETDPLLPYCSYLLRLRAFKKAMPAANRHAIPPVTTESGAPIKAATVPASTSPNCGPPMKKIILIEVMRPRKLFGVASCRIVCRRIVLTVSAAPVTASIRSENQKTRDRPNKIVAAPKIAIEQITAAPCFFNIPSRANTRPATTAPIAGEAARKPRPRAPTCKMSFAKIGSN